MLEFLGEMRRFALTVLGLMGLALLMAGPALAQEQTQKEPSKPPVQEGQPAAMPKMAAPAPEMKEEASRPSEKQEIRLRGKVTGKIGGQEIRAQEGEEDKQPR